jgi:hypothetical protein
MSRVLLRNPTTDVWLDLLAGPAVLRYLHVFNVDKTTSADIALAVMDTTITPLAKPANGSATPSGSTGVTKYEYFITASNANGETDPLSLAPIVDGATNLNDTTDYHTITWDAVPGATEYHIYVRVGDTIWQKISTTDTTAINDGSWPIAYAPPWLNMTNITCLLDYERLATGAILQMALDAEITATEKFVFATTNSLVNAMARYSEVS